MDYPRLNLYLDHDYHPLARHSELPPDVREFELTAEERASKRRSSKEVEEEERVAEEARKEVEERAALKNALMPGTDEVPIGSNLPDSATVIEEQL